MFARAQKGRIKQIFATNLFDGTGPNMISFCVPVSSPKA